MHLPSPLKKIPVLPSLLALTLVAGSVFVVLPVRATSPSGLSAEFLVGSSGGGVIFDEIDLSLKRKKDERNGLPEWKVKVDTKGLSELYVVKNTFAPGSTSGWHTHPGPSLISVLQGTITAYHGDDPTCTPRTYTAPASFLDEGGEHVHLLRNETGAPAVTVAVQLVPQGAMRRVDAPNPGHCPSIN